MRWSQYYLFTTREVPADAEVVSHQLMVRAGMIKKVAAGIYTYLPLGWRSLQKLDDIVRREMDAAGADRAARCRPSSRPSCGWSPGRWQQYGKELLRIKDRHERDFVLRPDARGGRSPTSCAATSRATASCRSTSTRSRPSSATRSGRASA